MANVIETGDSLPLEEVWQSLVDELDLWTPLDQVATFWWRDDDATAAGPKLERLLELTEETGILLAVIPAKLNPSLIEQVTSFNKAYIAQHGFAHINYAPRGVGAGAWELGLHRDAEHVLDELKQGKHILESAFNDRFIPVVVPPWNRLDPNLHKPIEHLGYEGLSLFGDERSCNVSSTFVNVNSHCDPIRWKQGAKFAGLAKSVRQIIEHLQARRCGVVAIHEPTGYLTHHIDLDADAWSFSETLCEVITRHSSAQWISPITAFSVKS